LRVFIVVSNPFFPEGQRFSVPQVGVGQEVGGGGGGTVFGPGPTYPPALIQTLCTFSTALSHASVLHKYPN